LSNTVNIMPLPRAPESDQFMKKQTSGVTRNLVLALTIVLSAPVLFAEDTEEAGGLYRYRNADGVLVIDYAIPPQYTEQGYDIISPSGTLIRRVPSKAEMKTVSPEEQQAQAERQKEDAFILASYSSLSDIENARRRKLESIQREIDILKANFSDAIRRQEELRDKAAAYQASGQTPPDSILQVIDELSAQQANIQKLMEERRKDIALMNGRFDRHAARLLELRPNLAEPQNKAPKSGKSPN
jgi:hypothetical protein